MEQGTNAPFLFSVSLVLCLPLDSNTCSFTLQGDPWVVGQNQRGGGQPAESHPVWGQNEPTHGLGHCHTSDNHHQRSELQPSAGKMGLVGESSQTLPNTKMITRPPPFVGPGGLHERQEEGPGGPVGSFNRAAETTAVVASRKGLAFLLMF